MLSMPWSVTTLMSIRPNNHERGIELMRIVWFAALLPVLAGCAPTVQLKAPEKPITINLNVKIDHEIRVKVNKDLEQLFSEDSDLF